jgi:hypothetical protein
MNYTSYLNFLFLQHGEDFLPVTQSTLAVANPSLRHTQDGLNFPLEFAPV